MELFWYNGNARYKEWMIANGIKLCSYRNTLKLGQMVSNNGSGQWQAIRRWVSEKEGTQNKQKTRKDKMNEWKNKQRRNRNTHKAPRDEWEVLIHQMLKSAEGKWATKRRSVQYHTTTLLMGLKIEEFTVLYVLQSLYNTWRSDTNRYNLMNSTFYYFIT
jgi:hypothetical protein